MHHYGLGYRETLNLPVKMFWMLNKNISRHHADEDFRQASLHVGVQSEQGFRNLLEGLQKRIGQIIVIDEGRVAVNQARLDRAGMVRLKSLAARLKDDGAAHSG